MFSFIICWFSEKISKFKATHTHTLTKGLESFFGFFFFLRVRLGIVGVFESVPVGDGSSRRRQHVSPVTKLTARGTTADNHFTDRVRCSDQVVIEDCHYQAALLDGARKMW